MSVFCLVLMFYLHFSPDSDSDSISLMHHDEIAPKNARLSPSDPDPDVTWPSFRDYLDPASFNWTQTHTAMSFAFNNILHALYMRSEQKKQRKHLQTVTQGFILPSLLDCLIQDRADIHTSEVVFNRCSFRDSPQGVSYWTKESLGNHLRHAHPRTVFPEKEINVLWSCFYYYAYHPFPRQHAEQGKLQFPAFQRAVMLLAVQGTQMLGTIQDDGGLYWRHYGHGTRRQGINRIFRSISQVNNDPGPQVADSSTFMMDDVMDALAMTNPHLQLHQSPGMLNPVAQRLLEGTETQHHTDMDSICTLLGLMNSLQVGKMTWGQGFYYGSLEGLNPKTEELANILARPFQLDQGPFASPDAILEGLDILPNLEQRFHQLWATIFQPPLPEGYSIPQTPSPPESCIDEILRAVALFIPPFDPGTKPERTPRDGLVSFQPLFYVYAKGLNGDLLDCVIRDIARDIPERSSHIVLFVGEQSPNSIPEVAGVFFPRRPNTKNVDNDLCENGDELSVDPPQLPFKLKPSFRLFRCNETSNMSRTELSGIFTELCCMGDPVSHPAIFTQRGTGDKGMYQRVFPRNPDKMAPATDGIEVASTTFTVKEISVLRVEGGEGAAIDRIRKDDPRSGWKLAGGN